MLLSRRVTTPHLVDLAVISPTWPASPGSGRDSAAARPALRDYFLGGRTAPWWAISLSIVSAETSTLTIVGTPALAFGGNLGFLQMVFGYLLARMAISFCSCRIIFAARCSPPTS
jgi:SSS family solute:Na+ symporter